MIKMQIAFTSKEIGPVTIKNRIVRSATYEASGTIKGHVTDKLVKLYEELAQGGAGLIVKGFTYVHPEGRAFALMTGIHDDSFIPGLKRIAQTVHEHDSRIFLQLAHAGREVGPGGWEGELIAPSPLVDPVSKKEPREMELDDIETITKAFADGARRAFEAEYDGIQLHAAHGYLINQFLSPHTNKRTDKYGGTLNNRMRFVLEVYEKVRDQVGKDFPVIMKMNATDFVETGIQIEEAIRMAEEFEKVGFDGIEISGAIWESATLIKPFAFPPECRRIKSEDEEGYHVEHAAKIRERVKLPLIVVGGIRSLEMVDKVLQEGIADFCSFARPFISEPDFPNKWKSGKSVRSECISCNKCGMDVPKVVTQLEEYPGVRCIYKERKKRKDSA